MTNILRIPVLAAALALPLALVAEGDAAAGEKVFGKCKTCHQIGPDAKNRLGPQLNGIVGATAGQIEGFNYSDAMMAKGEEGHVWDEANLDTYLESPRDAVPGTKMVFPGLKDEADRANVIAYLATFGPDGAPAE